MYCVVYVYASIPNGTLHYEDEGKFYTRLMYTICVSKLHALLRGHLVTSDGLNV